MIALPEQQARQTIYAMVDAGTKARIVPVDAVGVTESNKTDSLSLESKPTVAFDKLLCQFARGFRDEDTLIQVA